MGAIQTPHVSVSGARSQTPSVSAPRLEFPLRTQIRSCSTLFGIPLSTPGRAPGAASAENGRPGWPVARSFRRGSVMTRGQNRPRWELSADFDSENPARSLPPGRRSRVSDPAVPKFRQINLPGQPVRACAGPGSAPAPATAGQLARRRGIPHSHPTQELTAALSSQTRRTVLRQGPRRFQGREFCDGAPVANSVSSSNGADAKLTECRLSEVGRWVAGAGYHVTRPFSVIYP